MSDNAFNNCKEVYLDNNATTRVLPQIARIVNHAMQICYGNPSSSHITGVKAKHILESTRTLAREVIGANTGEIIFTSGATEGIQTAIVSSLLSIRQKHTNTQDSYLLYGATEHKAVPNTLEYWNKALGVNARIKAIPVDSKGILDIDFINAHIADSLMICTMAVNNETGVYQDLDQLDKVIRNKNEAALWLVDCVQVLGKAQLSISNTTIDYAPFSGHKVYTPKGVGMLYVREDSPCTPFIAGGGQENGIRSGTENIPGIAALGGVFKLLLDDNDTTFKPEKTLKGYRQQLADTLKEVFPKVVFNNDFELSVATTINFSVQGMSSKEIMDLCDAASIRVSSGSACASKTTRSFVLDAMGAESWQSESAIRLSFGPATTQQEIDQACEAIHQIVPALQHSCLIISDVYDATNALLKTGFMELKYGDCCCWMYVDMTAGECIIVDPLPELTDRIERWVRCHGLTVKVVMDTHTHYDHTSYQQTLKDILTEHVPSQHRETDANGWPLVADGKLALGDQLALPFIQIGRLKAVVIDTSGHTTDSRSVLFIDETGQVQLALVGDLLMPGGFGRTDVKSGDSLAFCHSLSQLNKLVTPQTIIGCSHDYQHHFVTTLATECKDNTLLAQVLDGTINNDIFVHSKAEIDGRLRDESNEYLCGLVAVGNVDEPYSLPADDINAFLSKNHNATVIDVRESYECEVGDLQSQLNLQHAAINVPLTNLADFAINDKYRDNGPLLLVCRTGNRSLLACKSLIRLGYSEVHNIKGGLALYNG